MTPSELPRDSKAQRTSIPRLLWELLGTLVSIALVVIALVEALGHQRYAMGTFFIALVILNQTVER